MKERWRKNTSDWIYISNSGVKFTDSNVTDLLASQVPQLLDQGSKQFSLLLRKLRNQLLQKGPNLGQTAARSHPNTCREASVLTDKAYFVSSSSPGHAHKRCRVLNLKSFVLAGRIIVCTTTKGGYPPCGVWVTSNSSITLVADIISGCRTPLNFISGPSTQSRKSLVTVNWSESEHPTQDAVHKSILWILLVIKVPGNL